MKKRKRASAGVRDRVLDYASAGLLVMLGVVGVWLIGTYLVSDYLFPVVNVILESL